MTTAAFQATYSDWKPVKTRRVIQIIFEVPWEAHDSAYKALGGMPDPGAEQWFAIAKLNPEAKEQESVPVSSNEPARARKPWGELPVTSQIAIRCNEVAFQKFLEEKYADAWRICNVGEGHQKAAELVRWQCDVQSRRDIRPGTESFDNWIRLEGAYQAWRIV